MKHRKKKTRLFYILVSRLFRAWPISLVIFFMFLAVISASIFFVYSNYYNLSNTVISRRQSTASLVASNIKVQLNEIVSIGLSYANDKGFIRIVESGNWSGALDYEDHILRDAPFIERAGILSTKGELVAALPKDDNSITLGIDLSARDYFKKVVSTKKPYVSELLKSAVPTLYNNIVVVAMPILGTNDGLLGILIFNLKINSIFGWENNVDLGSSGSVYVVDQKGNLIPSSVSLLAEDRMNLSSVPSVKKVLTGEPGYLIGFDQLSKDERINTYAPVKGYGWGVVVSQPTSIAFQDRNSAIITLITVELAVVVILVAGTYTILRDRSRLKLQRDRENVLLDSIADSVIAIDRSWKITLWNESAERLLGWMKEEVMNQSLLDHMKFIRENDRKEDIKFIEDVMLSGQVQDLDHATILTGKSNKDITASVSVAPIHANGGEVIGAVIAVRDVSKKREISMLRSDFAYASHQLRTPVTEALWLLESVLEEADSKKIKKNAKMAHESLESVQKMSDELVTVSEIDQGDVYLDNGKFKLIDLFDEVTDAVGKKAEEHKIKLKMPEIESSASVVSSQKLLKRILIELIDNSIAYGRKGDEIIVGVKIDKSNMIFEIKDMGIGIDIEHQPLVFTKFFRGSNFSTSEIAGAGLGLYIARGYTKILGGNIWFKSEKKGPNKGTAFYVSIPLPANDISE